MVAYGPTARLWSWAGLAVLGMLGVLTTSARTRGETPKPPAAEPPPEVINLTRATYKLKSATAEAVVALLKDNVKSGVLETKLDGDTLTVTTTPEAQYAVGQFIALLQGKPLGPIPGGFTGPGPGGPFGPPGGTFGPFGPGPGGSFGPFGPGPGGTAFPGPGGTTRPPATPGSTSVPPGH